MHYPPLGLDETKMLSLYMGEVGHIPSVHVGSVPEAAMATDTNSTVLTLDNLATRIMHTHTQTHTPGSLSSGDSRYVECFVL